MQARRLEDHGRFTKSNHFSFTPPQSQDYIPLMQGSGPLFPQCAFFMYIEMFFLSNKIILPIKKKKGSGPLYAKQLGKIGRI
jgi:hypothetical protein